MALGPGETCLAQGDAALSRWPATRGPAGQLTRAPRSGHGNAMRLWLCFCNKHSTLSASAHPVHKGSRLHARVRLLYYSQCITRLIRASSYRSLSRRAGAAAPPSQAVPPPPRTLAASALAKGNVAVLSESASQFSASALNKPSSSPSCSCCCCCCCLLLLSGCVLVQVFIT